ncbi:aldo/keto reductase [Cohaesibacter haloalkalitolerans]|uniref:aldo/keto reductase n=1 Tax=Cohaesibacter haloalkalitolerans TaxID=1162980 RepID=UPI000E657B73|nr:aldo/keto reductase [Cohaesibacter haloalkalitolerans]
MDTKPILLNDGHSMPTVGYGVWQIRNARAEDLVRRAITVGYRHIDTAQAYDNEEGVGRGLKASGLIREELFVTSKLRGRHMGYDKAIRSCRESLERLQLDYLDLFLIHWPMPKQDLYVETWEALIEFQSKGLLRSIGVSNFTSAHIDRLIGQTGVVPSVNQIEIHPYFQQLDIRDHHAKLGIAIESYSPLGGCWGGELQDHDICSIAKKHGRTAAQVILRWHLQQALVPLPKTATPTRLSENLDIWDFVLDEDDLERIAGLDQPGGNTQPHPNSMNSTF